MLFSNTLFLYLNITFWHVMYSHDSVLTWIYKCIIFEYSNHIVTCERHLSDFYMRAVIQWKCVFRCSALCLMKSAVLFIARCPSEARARTTLKQHHSCLLADSLRKMSVLCFRLEWAGKKMWKCVCEVETFFAAEQVFGYETLRQEKKRGLADMLASSQRVWFFRRQTHDLPQFPEQILVQAWASLHPSIQSFIKSEHQKQLYLNALAWIFYYI